MSDATDPMKTYAQITLQIASLQREAEAIRKREIAGVVSRIKEAIEVYQLTASDLGLEPKRVIATSERPKPAGKKRPPVRKKVAVKYRDGAGNTWTGRGTKPRWLAAALTAGKRLEEFLV
jgi:DNA-binding protein H-NS